MCATHDPSAQAAAPNLEREEPAACASIGKAPTAQGRYASATAQRQGPMRLPSNSCSRSQEYKQAEAVGGRTWGAVMRSSSCPCAVWKVTCRENKGLQSTRLSMRCCKALVHRFSTAGSQYQQARGTAAHCTACVHTKTCSPQQSSALTKNPSPFAHLWLPAPSFPCPALTPPLHKQHTSYGPPNSRTPQKSLNNHNTQHAPHGRGPGSAHTPGGLQSGA